MICRKTNKLDQTKVKFNKVGEKYKSTLKNTEVYKILLCWVTQKC